MVTDGVLVVCGSCDQDYYIRTSSKKFSLDNLGDKVVHLTNDAVSGLCSSPGHAMAHS